MSKNKKGLAQAEIDAYNNELNEIEAELAELLQEEEYVRAEENLYSYLQACWQYIDPSEFKGNWHLQAICDHLQAMYEGHIKDLIVTLPPRHGKCLDEDTLVSLADGTVKRIADLEVGSEVYSSDGTKVLTDLVVSKECTGKKEVYRITLSDGTYIDATEEHRLHQWDKWIEVKNLKVGDCLTVGQTFPTTNTTSNVSKDDAFLIALYLSEGTKKVNLFSITNDGNKVLERAKTICSKKGWHFNKYECSKYKYSFTNTKEAEISPTKFLRSYGLIGHTTYNIRVPDQIMSAPLNVVAEFLSCYIACDGYISYEAGTVGITSVSKLMIQDLHLLVKRFGIKGTICRKFNSYTGSDKLFESWSLNISGLDNISRLSEFLDIPDKQEKLLSLLDRLKSAKPSADRTFPPQWRSLLKGTTSHYRHKHNIRIDKPGWTDRLKVKNIAELENNQKLKDLISGGLGWRKIIKIENIGLRNTYDIETAKHHAFFANGVLSHNSTLISVAFPTWLWIKKPTIKLITACYGDDLAVRDSVKSRRLIDSPWYKKRWADTFKLSADQNRKDRYDNNHNAYRLATSVGGVGTGEGFDWLIIDDAMKAQDASSDAKRESVIEWWKGTVTTRANDIKTARRIIIGQRLHENDLPGYLIEQGGWEVLNLPARYEGSKYITKIGWQDPRTKEGQVLWESRYPDDELSKLEKELGPHQASAQLQQRPVPKGAGVFPRHKFKLWVSVPKQFDRVTQSWDFALDGDDLEQVSTTLAYSVGQVWGQLGADHYLLWEERGQWDIIGMLEAVERLTARHPEARAKLVENKAAGRPIVKMLQRKISGFILIEPKDYGGNKVARAQGCIPEIISGNVWIPNPDIPGYDWIGTKDEAKDNNKNSWLNEVTLFPKHKYKDRVDTMTQYLNWVISMFGTGISNTIIQTETTEFYQYKQLLSPVSSPSGNPVNLFGSPKTLRGIFES